MQFKQRLQPKILIKCYKRFLADIELEDKKVLTVHCPNTVSISRSAGFHNGMDIAAQLIFSTVNMGISGETPKDEIRFITEIKYSNPAHNIHWFIDLL